MVEIRFKAWTAKFILTNNSVRFEVLMAVTIKNAVFWDIKTPFVSQSKYITSPLQSSAG
jgi:hypothetical protein